MSCQILSFLFGAVKGVMSNSVFSGRGTDVCHIKFYVFLDGTVKGVMSLSILFCSVGGFQPLGNV